MSKDEEKEVLKPCPFCGHKTPDMVQPGTSRHSCIVECGWCGCRHESGDEGAQSGTSWNTRADDAIRDQEAAKRVQLEAQIARQAELIKRFGEWDMLDVVADGPFWKSEIEKMRDLTQPTADAFVARIKAEVKEEDAAILKEYVPDFVWEQLPADSAAKQAIGRLLNDASDLRKGKE